MSRLRAFGLIVAVAVAAFVAGRLFTDPAPPEVPEPIVLEQPDTSSPGSVPSRSAPSTTSPVIVPPPTVGPSSPAPPDDDDDNDDDDDDDDVDDVG